MDLLPLPKKCKDQWIQMPFSTPISYDNEEKYVLLLKDEISHDVFFTGEKQKMAFGVINQKRAREKSSIDAD